ncbi:MAG: hypothetical protein ABT01_00595 [Clostridium sp. SCN 57-10]|nr:MAG: hypothetical protein ABT01_00595 [Clostridium sp. SCN 57-10]
MEQKELLRRVADLSARAAQRGVVTHTAFLTPAERELVRAGRMARAPLFCGGYDGAEREMAFFLPDWLTEDAFAPEEYIAAIEVKTPFASLTHRDFLGSVLGLGVERDAVGDIVTSGEGAYLLLAAELASFVQGQLARVGRAGAQTRIVPLHDVPQPHYETREVSFTVMSARLDAVAAGLFGVSRAAAAQAVADGKAALNHAECLKPDAEVREGDVIALRGKGKARGTQLGGTSRKGRLFVTGELYL